MDEATRLVSELQSKLAELDHKVWRYRRDMASEFTKHAEGLLRDVPKDVSETVSRAIADSMKDYKSLNLDAKGSVEACAAGTSILENDSTKQKASRLTTVTSPCLSIPYQTREEDVDESPRSPHEREKEFQGLFTPSYLPLLDSTNRNERRSSRDSSSSPQPQHKGKESAMESRLVDASTEITRSLAASPELRRPPTPKRRNTDEVSIASDWSDGVTRRSALRRSSTSSSKLPGSPRRVRFEVEGQEVLPTASPLPSQTILHTDIPESPSFGEDSDEEAESEQIEDINEPAPKRISSSQALRALSRTPLVDDGTQWTAVSAPPDGSASIAISGGISQESSSEDLLPMSNGLSRLNIGNGYGLEEISVQGNEYAQNASTGASRAAAPPAYNNDSEESSDDDMLDMPPLRSMRGQKSTQSPTYATPVENARSPTASTRPGLPWIGVADFGKPPDETETDLRFTEEDQEQLFHFDENTEHHSPPEPEHDESETVSPASPVTGKSPIEPVSLSSYSQSPARQIIKPSSGRNATPAQSNVVGSYKNHPFSMPIVSPEIHAKAEALGDMSSFVGSVHGTSGLDETDVLSFRNSGVFSGTPKSMSERMYMDDLKEGKPS
jgi:hypothetical protein